MDLTRKSPEAPRGFAGFRRAAYASLVAVAVSGSLAAGDDHKAASGLPHMIDLKPYYQTVFTDPSGADSTFLGYSGHKTIDGLPFDIGGEIVFYGESEDERNSEHPASVAGIKIGRKFDELHLVHAARWREYAGCPIATIRLHYADGTQHDFPIRDGFEVNDWNRLLTENDELLSDPDTKIIWRGAGAFKGTGRLFKTVLHNPFPKKMVDTMEISSTGSSMSYMLVAATVAPTDSHRVVTPGLPLFPSRNFDGRLNVHVVEKATGLPIAGAEVFTAWVTQGYSLIGDPILSGPNGIATVKFPKNETTSLRVEVVRNGYVTCDTNWQNGWDGANAPADVTYELDATPPAPADAAAEKN